MSDDTGTERYTSRAIWIPSAGFVALLVLSCSALSAAGALWFVVPSLSTLTATVDGLQKQMLSSDQGLAAQIQLANQTAEARSSENSRWRESIVSTIGGIQDHILGVDNRLPAYIVSADKFAEHDKHLAAIDGRLNGDETQLAQLQQRLVKVCARLESILRASGKAIECEPPSGGRTP